MLIGEVKGRALYKTLRCSIMGGAECQLSSLLVGTCIPFPTAHGVFALSLLRIWCQMWRTIIRASDSLHMWNVRTFADFIDLVQFHSKL